jgi:PHD/YefM family antitoxin component YafN of YafNO toxin-antitoxin module
MEPLRLSISEARARLPELAQRVMDTPGEMVIIEHRDREERLVLTSESHIRMLQARAEALVKRMQKGTEFKLAGSLHTDLSDDELEAWLQAAKVAQHAEDQRRLSELLEE